ncbi:hypothetical protein H6F73_12720 [Microcoleus sp. FACHB-68]|nr:hypothetical protein [Microcoleus sp. FACHB-68]
MIFLNLLQKKSYRCWQFPKVTLGKSRSLKKRIFNPNQFPSAFIARIIQATSNRKELVFDSFMESGTIAIAALMLSLLAFGIELRQDDCEITVTDLRIFYDKSKFRHSNYLYFQTGNICKCDNFRP